MILEAEYYYMKFSLHYTPMAYYMTINIQCHGVQSDAPGLTKLNN